MSKNQEQEKPLAKQTRTQRFARGSQEFDHDLFKLKPAIVQKNVSWTYRQPSLVPVEHVHFFHSINDTTMQPNKNCSPVGGHFHEVIVEWEVGPDGEKTIKSTKCGPPMHMIVRRVANGRTIRRQEQVSYEKFDDNGDVTKLMENHTHDFEYLGSETFNANSKNELRKDEQNKIKGLMAGQPVSRQPGAQESLHTGADKDAVKPFLKEGSEKHNA